MQPKRMGFTLVELLVVIAIIGILVALLLPAIQAAREAGRRISCGNNIHQLALSLHEYHDVHNAFPLTYGNHSSAYPAYGVNSTGKSWMTGVLPFIEQKSLYDKIAFYPTPSANSHTIGNPPITNPPGSGTDRINTPVAMTIIKSYLCPSDGDNGRGIMSGRANVGGPWAVNNYKACCGSNWAWNNGSPNTANFAQASGHESRAPAPCPNSNDGLNCCNGIMCRNDSNNSALYHDFAFITDGTANTFAIGEAVPRWCNHTWWWWFNGTTATCAIPLNYKSPEILAGQPISNVIPTLESRLGDWPANYSFMSRHPNGAQFGMADGAVKFVPDTVDFITYQRLGTCAGGRPAQLPQ